MRQIKNISLIALIGAMVLFTFLFLQSYVNQKYHSVSYYEEHFPYSNIPVHMVITGYHPDFEGGQDVYMDKPESDGYLCYRMMSMTGMISPNKGIKTECLNPLTGEPIAELNRGALWPCLLTEYEIEALYPDANTSGCRPEPESTIHEFDQRLGLTPGGEWLRNNGIYN